MKPKKFLIFKKLFSAMGKVSYKEFLIKKKECISDENNYSKRSLGLFRCKSSLIMTSVQDDFPDFVFRLISRGG